MRISIQNNLRKKKSFKNKLTKLLTRFRILSKERIQTRKEKPRKTTKKVTMRRKAGVKQRVEEIQIKRVRLTMIIYKERVKETLIKRNKAIHILLKQLMPEDSSLNQKALLLTKFRQRLKTNLFPKILVLKENANYYQNYNFS